MIFLFRNIVATSLVCSLSLVTLPSLDLGGVHVVGSSVHAASKKKIKPPVALPGCKAPPAKRKLKTVTQKFQKKMVLIDDLMYPPEDKKTGKAASPNYKKAWSLLKKRLDKCTDCPKTELAQLYHRAALIQFNFDDTTKAISYFKKVINQAPDIHISLETGLTYQIAQLYASQEKYKDAIKAYDKWESLCPSTVSDSYFYGRGQVYYYMGNKDKAVKLAQKSIDLAKAKGQMGKESWYRLQMSVYLDKEDFKSAERVAELMVVHYPKPTLMHQLTQIYGMNGKSKKQMALLDALKLGGLFERESHYKNLAYLYLENNVPYLASRVMKEGVNKKVVKRTSKNLEVWAASLAQAQESAESLPIMLEAAKKSEKGKIYARLAAIYLNEEQYKEAVAAAKKALKKGGLRSEAEVHMYLGSAYLSLESYNSSISSLEKALKDKKYKKYAANLLKYVKGEKRRSDALKKAKLKG